MTGDFRVRHWPVIFFFSVAHAVTVEVGDQQGSNWIIESGIQPGQRVVIEGLEKAKDGAVVNPKVFQSRNVAAEPENKPTTNNAATQTAQR